MNEMALDVLMRLARTTLLLSMAVAVLVVMLRLGRLQSAHWRRGLTVLALLQGVFWFQVPLPVPWYEPAQPAAEVHEPAGQGPPRIIIGADEPTLPMAPPAPEPLLTGDIAPKAASPPPEVPAPDPRMTWPVLICGVWLAGLVAIAGAAVLRYIAFVRRLPPPRSIEPHWLKELEDARAAMNAVGRLRFQVTETLGPLLCWTPRGSLLIVPDALWRALNGEQRSAVLRHELAHFQRGDLFKSLLIRILALPHWFNPLAWWAVRKFEEAGEWICDDLAARHASTAYAAALVRLCEPPPRAIWPTTAARGSGVADRVRRLLEVQTMEDSTMKKLILAAAALALLIAGIVRVELVAQPRPEANSKSEDIAARNTERAVKQKAMIDAARATYDAILEAHSQGRLMSNNEVYLWSSYIRSSQVRAADSRQQVTKACQAHLDRMQSLHDGVAALGREGAKGGEMDKQYAAQFYVAEAELLLLEAKANERVELTPKLPRDQ
jgi:beta-lactamase regulating signal transducer with metallopeptidase domain